MVISPFETTRPLLAASILSADFGKLAAEMDEVLTHGADFVHLDVMDGHFVPNISFGPPVIGKARRHTQAYFDAHLMVTEPLRYAPPCVQAGAQNITFHVETVPDPAAAAREIRKLGCSVGITLNPSTPVELLYPALDEVDVVLIMSVVPGFSGQKFIAQSLEKVRTIKPRLRANQRIEIDGGINTHTISDARDAGVDWFVVASAMFDVPDRPVAIAQLRERLSR